MARYHAAVTHRDGRPDTYCGIVDQDHADTVRALAARDDVPRVVKDHPRNPGEFFVLREDGFLDHYAPVDGV